MKHEKLEVKLNKELKTKLIINDAVIQLLLIYIHCLPKASFHRKFNRNEKLEASRLVRIIGRKTIKQLDLPHASGTVFDWLSRLTKNNRRHVSQRIPQSTIDLLLKIASENIRCGYKFILGTLNNLGIRMSKTSIIRILKENEIPPFKRRKISFFDQITNTIKWNACDMAKVTISTPFKRVTISILFFINIKTRKIHISGCTENPDADWTRQMVRNVTMADWGFMSNGDRLIHDGDGCFVSHRVQNFLKASEITPIKTPPYSPNCNAFAERFIGTLRAQCLDRLFFFSEDQLRKALKQFEEFYNTNRNHQGIGNVLIDNHERNRISTATGAIRKRSWLAGNNYYYRESG